MVLFNVELHFCCVSADDNGDTDLLQFRRRTQNRALAVASSGTVLVAIGAALTATRRRVSVAVGWGITVAGLVAIVAGYTKFVIS